MKNIVLTEFLKIKRYAVLWIGVATMFAVVLLTRFMAIASDGSVHTLSYFSSNTIWNNLVLIYPATITLIAGYIIERERTDDTLKNILALSISFRKLLAGKLIAVGLVTVILSLIEFAFMMAVFFISRFPGFTVVGAIQSLFQMAAMNLFAYVAVLPIIAFMGQRSGSFMAGVGFAFFYGFIGMMASGHGLRDIYPITAGLSLIQNQKGADVSENPFVGMIVLSVMLVISVLIVLNAKDREVKATAKKPKGVRQTVLKD